MKRQAIKDLLLEPSTYAGIAAILLASFGLETLSAEQVSTVLVSIAAIFLKEKAHK